MSCYFCPENHNFSILTFNILELCDEHLKSSYISFCRVVTLEKIREVEQSLDGRGGPSIVMALDLDLFAKIKKELTKRNLEVQEEDLSWYRGAR